MPLSQPNETLYTAEDYFNTSEEDRVELIKGEFYDMASPSTMHQIISRELLIDVSIYDDLSIDFKKIKESLIS